MTYVVEKSRKGELPQTVGLKESLLSTFSTVPEDIRIVKMWINVNELSGNEELPMLRSFEPSYYVLGNQIDTEISFKMKLHLKSFLRFLFKWEDKEYLKFCLKIAIPQDLANSNNFRLFLKIYNQKYTPDTRVIDHLGPCFLYDLRQLHEIGGHELVRAFFRYDGQNFIYMTRAPETQAI
jgi:hypothetical protein